MEPRTYLETVMVPKEDILRKALSPNTCNEILIIFEAYSHQHVISLRFKFSV